MRHINTVLLTITILVMFTIQSIAQASAGSLPVIFVSFDVHLNTDESIAVSWTTKQQISTDLFNIEKSSDGASWHSIAVVHATGTTTIPVSYNIVDKFPMKGSNYYRILFKNLNGEFGYTNIQNVKMSSVCKIAVYPNPSTGMVNILLDEIPASNWNLLLINSAGKIVIHKHYNRYTTAVNLPVDAYPTGMYTLEIADASSRKQNKLMINHN